MGGPSYSPVVVIGYELVPQVSPEHYKIWKQSERFSAGTANPLANNWYRRIIFRERYMLAHPEMKILFSKWKVEMGDERYFTVGNALYNGVLVVLGAEKCFWVFYNRAGRQDGGMGEMKCSYCNCCIGDQYLNILAAVRDMALERRKITSVDAK